MTARSSLSIVPLTSCERCRQALSGIIPSSRRDPAEPPSGEIDPIQDQECDPPQLSCDAGIADGAPPAAFNASSATAVDVVSDRPHGYGRKVDPSCHMVVPVVSVGRELRDIMVMWEIRGSRDEAFASFWISWWG